MTKLFQSTSISKGAPGYSERTGQSVEIVRMLTDAEYDAAEVGLMYRVLFSDGIETDAFECEIVENSH